MTKNEFERRAHLERSLTGLGFTVEEVDKLRRISCTLQHWYEKECGTEYGFIERDEATDRPFWTSSRTGKHVCFIADREKGAIKRLAAIMAQHAPLTAYLQTDPRGASLYLIRPGDVPAGEDVGAYYSRGICVY